jgi:hypothetical protein
VTRPEEVKPLAATPAAARTKDSRFDAPVDDPAGDLLGVNSLAEALADFITAREGQLPFTLGVFGEWGEGKTTLVRLLRRRLERPEGAEAPRPVNFVEFSAWDYNTSEKLWRALVLKIAEVLYRRPVSHVGRDRAGGAPPGGTTNEADRRGAVRDGAGADEGGTRPSSSGGLLGSVEKFFAADAIVLRNPAPAPDKYEEVVRRLERTDFGQVSRRGVEVEVDEEATMAAVFNGAVAALSAVSPFAAVLRGLFGVEPKVDPSRLLKRGGEATREKIEALPAFQQVFREIVADKPHAGPVYVFIDDLDRAQPDVALNIMESIRLALWEPGCVFIIAVDERLIAQGLRLRYRDLFAGEEKESLQAKGQEYLEKIIQFRVRVPPRTPEQVQRLIAAEHPEWLAAGDIIQMAAGTNPRRVKQYCQRLTLQRIVDARLLEAERRRATHIKHEEEGASNETQRMESFDIAALRDKLIGMGMPSVSRIAETLGFNMESFVGDTFADKVENLINACVEAGLLAPLNSLAIIPPNPAGPYH